MNLKPNHLVQSAQRIEMFINRTPVLTNAAIDEVSGAKVFLKCENLQKIAAFKIRGAFNMILSLSPDQLKKGVATHSSGNHAQAVALVAQTLGLNAHIVMPSNSPEIKIKGVREHKASITFCEPTIQAREETLKQVIEKTGATFIPPYDHELIIAGQATAAMELIADYPNLDAIIAPLGGGGLLSGTGLAARFFSPGTKVYGAEPETVNDGQRSFRSGELKYNPPTATTIADGLRTHLSPLTFAYISANTTDIFTVPEASIIAAMEMIQHRLKVIVEPSAAVPLAVLIEHKIYFTGQSVGIILSGGNVDHP